MVGNRLLGGRRAAALGLAAALSGAGGVLAAGVPAQAASSGQVYVVQGLPGQTLDVLLDGRTVQKAAKVKTIVGPLRLASGRHVVQLRNGSAVVATTAFKVTSGSSTDLVVHSMADATMGPQITAFANDLRPVAPGKVRLAVAHTAAAPAADIRVDGAVLFRNVANSESLTLVVPAKTYSIDIVPSASAGPVILGPVTLTLKAGTLTRVFAIGSVANGTVDAIVQTIHITVIGAAAPRSVPTGDGGQTATSFVGGGLPAPMLGAGLVTALALAIAWVGRARRRSGSGRLAG